MLISLTYGKGTGKTELSAFDAALWDAGIGDFNLITLSSVIPPDSRVEIRKLPRGNQGIGNKLYVVLSKCFATSTGEEAYAGLGWVAKEDGSGVFMEECGRSEEEVKQRIGDSLKSAISYRKGNFGSIDCLIEKIQCEDKPACAIVAAVYKSEGW
ncbi:MAG TPA: pyruvoyl-dependent arginine decarboxylase [Candidatus Nanoarchaeia archaeon]|nr:pyruvoyl-dependent arginine decarboxylase [Candidatus Nanoarchaeia archaeon]